METIETLRTINKKSFRVDFVAHPEHTHPSETIGWDDPEAEAEYVRRVETGFYPWFCLGVHVSYRGHVLGSAFLGGVDTERLHDVGVRDLVSEAVEQARAELEAMAEGYTLLREGRQS